MRGTKFVGGTGARSKFAMTIVRFVDKLVTQMGMEGFDVATTISVNRIGRSTRT
jgi:hypothetical protein